jgi:hypothetical protein
MSAILMMGTGIISETLVIFNQSTQLMAQEDFISLHIINISMKPVRISEVEVTLTSLDIHMALKYVNEL